jgi:lipopolysaccharide/colanic/teichoic acid biosynthesis glycosyltransferase
MTRSLYVRTKRFADAACAGTMTVLLLPLLLVVAGLVHWRMGSPVLFRQLRPGIHERPFELLKFRTMVDVRDSSGEPLPDEQRLTFLGSLLRRSSLDELPTLINVIRGDMSLVGPRPLLLRYLPYFTERERLRFSVPPGITGWAQIRGRNHTPWSQRLEQDVWYVEHQGPWLDTKILLRTALQVLLARGVVVDARSIMLNLDEERDSPDNGPAEVDDHD